MAIKRTIHFSFSSVAYNPYLKQQLAASDYDGTLSIWDTHHSKCIHTYQVSVVYFEIKFYCKAKNTFYWLS